MSVEQDVAHWIGYGSIILLVIKNNLLLYILYTVLNGLRILCLSIYDYIYNFTHTQAYIHTYMSRLLVKSCTAKECIISVCTIKECDDY